MEQPAPANPVLTWGAFSTARSGAPARIASPTIASWPTSPMANTLHLPMRIVPSGAGRVDRARPAPQPARHTRPLSWARCILQFDGARKQDVVLQMNVSMQVLLEFPQTIVERVKGRAGILRSGEIGAQAADFSNQ